MKIYCLRPLRFRKTDSQVLRKEEKSRHLQARLKDYSTEDFWNVIKGDLAEATQADIETYRPLVLNAFSHYNTERHEIKMELADAIQAVKDLKDELAKL
ncbi:MAG: hypothetical protein ACOX5Z_01270 [Desulfobulbus sp.]|jgi:hypothetical protein